MNVRTLSPTAPLRGASLVVVLMATTALHAAEKVTFEQHVKLIFREHCQACHSQDDASAGLALDGYDVTLAGGASGEVLASGDVDGSRLWKLINMEEEPVMPPGGDKIPADQLKTIRAWIEGGLLKDAGSKPKPSAKPAIAEVATDSSGKPQGEPAMPTGLFRQPVVTADTPGPVLSLAASRWAPVVATPWQRQVSFYHTETRALLGVIPYVEGAPQVVRFSRDGSLLLVAGGRHGGLGNAALYDVKSGARLATLGDELDIVLAADISADKSLVAIGGPKKKVRVYRTADGELAYELGKHTDWITALAFSPDGKLIATADRAAGVRTWDAAEGHERNDLRGHKASITALAWRADSAVLASASEDGTVRLWDSSGKPIKSINAHGGGALSVALAADGRLVTTGRDQKVKLWKPDGAPLADLGKMRDTTLAAVFDHSGKRVIACDYSGDVRVLEIASKKTLGALPPNPKTLQQQLAGIEAAIKKSEADKTQRSAEAETALATLADGERAHEAYQQRLTAANAQRKGAQEQFQTASAKLAEATASLTAAEAAASSSENAKHKADQALGDFKKQAQPEEENEQAVAAREEEQQKLEIAVQQAEETLAKANAVATELRRSRDATGKQLKQANAGVKQAESLLADVSNQQAGLPNLTELKQAARKATSAIGKVEELLSTHKQRSDTVAYELTSFNQAAVRLRGLSKSRSEAQTELAQSLGAAETEHTALAQEAAKQQEAIAQTQQQLGAIKKQLQRLQRQRRDQMAKVKASELQLAEVKARLAQTGRDAQVAEALLRDFAAAQALREAYAQQQAE